MCRFHFFTVRFLAENSSRFPVPEKQNDKNVHTLKCILQHLSLFKIYKCFCWSQTLDSHELNPKDDELCPGLLGFGVDSQTN